jgi:hypothetical protein
MVNQTATPGPAGTWVTRHRKLTAIALALVAVALVVTMILLA